MAFKFLLFFFLFNYKSLIIFCEVYCNKQTTLPPENKYHCSGLNISRVGNSIHDTHCCYWQFFDKEENRTKARCSSIDRSQFNNLTSYINKKESSGQYKDLKIECTADQSLYCSNVVLDEEKIDNCTNFKIYIEDDMFCCRWVYKNSKSDYKINDYCASINEYEYLTIEDYIRYKNDHPLQRYDDLIIDCLGNYLKFTISLLIILIFFIL